MRVPLTPDAVPGSGASLPGLSELWVRALLTATTDSDSEASTRMPREGRGDAAACGSLVSARCALAADCVLGAGSIVWVFGSGAKLREPFVTGGDDDPDSF